MLQIYIAMSFSDQIGTDGNETSGNNSIAAANSYTPHGKYDETVWFVLYCQSVNMQSTNFNVNLAQANHTTADWNYHKMAGLSLCIE